MRKIITREMFIREVKTAEFNSRINEYALERVAFGQEKPGDEVPLDLYLKHLGLEIDGVTYRRKDIPGVYINSQERITQAYDYETFVRDLFVLQMENIFSDAPRDADLYKDCADMPFEPRIRDYLFGIYPIFAEILNIEIANDLDFDSLRKDRVPRPTENDKCKKFVTDILIKQLKPGSNIDEYVKDWTEASYYVRRLIEKKGENICLRPIDGNNCVYILALFSLIFFDNYGNNILFKMKMLGWERRRNMSCF